ncbi:unnamed protein product [Prunus armeniaca]
MKDVGSSGAANLSIGCDTDDELLTVKDEECNGEVVANSSVGLKKVGLDFGSPKQPKTSTF